VVLLIQSEANSSSLSHKLHLLGGDGLLVASVQDVVLLVSQEAVVALNFIGAEDLKVIKVLEVITESNSARRRDRRGSLDGYDSGGVLGLLVFNVSSLALAGSGRGLDDARSRALLLKLGEDHLAGGEVLSLLVLGLGHGLDVLLDLRILLGALLVGSGPGSLGIALVLVGTLLHDLGLDLLNTELGDLLVGILFAGCVVGRWAGGEELLSGRDLRRGVAEVGVVVGIVTLVAVTGHLAAHSGFALLVDELKALLRSKVALHGLSLLLLQLLVLHVLLHQLLLELLLLLLLGLGEAAIVQGQLRRHGGLRLGSLDLNVTPQTVTEGGAVRGLDTPVADGLAFTQRRLESDLEGTRLTNLNLATNHIALGGLVDVSHRGWVAVVHVQHVVATNVADTAASGPGVGTVVVQGPDLGEAGTRCNGHSIRDAVADEGRTEQRSRGVELETRGQVGLGQRVNDWNWLGDLLLLLLDLRLELSNSLDLAGCIGNNLRGLRKALERAANVPVAHVANVTASILIHSGDADVLDRSLELDERVSAVVVVARQSLTGSAEVGVVAYGTLEASAHDVRWDSLILAQWAITVDASMASEHRLGLRNRVVDGGEAVTSVLERGVCNTSGAVVPVWAVEALVANAVDGLVTAIADGVVANVTAWSQSSLLVHAEADVVSSRGEAVSRVVTVLVLTVARNAQVKVLTSLARDELVLRKDIDAVVASASGHLHCLFESGHAALGLLAAIGASDRDLLLDALLGLAANALSGAGDNLAVFNAALDQPVTFTRAESAAGNAGLAEIVIAAIADAAMIVRIVHGVVAAVAVNRPLTLGGSHGSDSGLTATEGKLARSLNAGAGDGVEEVRAIRSERLRDWSLRLDESLLRSTSLAELEDTAADGTTVKSGRVARRSLVIGRANDDRLGGLLSRHGRGILR